MSKILSRDGRVGAGMAMVVAVLLAGCTGPTVTAPGDLNAPGGGLTALQEEFQYYADNSSTDFERDVLERAVDAGSISPADYEEAVSRYLQCAQAAGYTIDTVKQANGIYQWLPQVDDADFQGYVDATNKCAEGTVMVIEGLYKEQVANPDGLDSASAVARCFQKYGVVDADYTAEDFTRDYDNQFKDVSYQLTDANVTMCLTSLGFAVSG